jgi:hypothetical protein
VRVSLPTLILLDLAGDTAATTIAHVWKDEAGFLIEPPHLQAYYRGKTDRLVLYLWDQARVICPGEWSSSIPDNDVGDFGYIEQRNNLLGD